MRKTIALLTMLTPTAAIAHPGHGVVGDPTFHLLAEPIHALPLLVVIAGAAALLIIRRVEKSGQSEKSRTR